MRNEPIFFAVGPGSDPLLLAKEVMMGKYTPPALAVVDGIAGANTTGPLHAPLNDTSADPAFQRGAVLYNLRADPSETTNLADQPEHAATLQMMLARLRELAREQVYPMTMVRPFQGPDYECANCPTHPENVGDDFAKRPWGSFVLIAILPK